LEVGVAEPREVMEVVLVEPNIADLIILALLHLEQQHLIT